MLHDSDLPKFLWAEAAQHAVYLKNRTWTRTIGDTTPYKLLINLGNLQLWGCKVRVHNTGNSKLDGHSKIGRWMGFDTDTRDGHRVYWPERRMVTVKRSVKFNFDDEVVVEVLPLEGEHKGNEHLPETPTSDTEINDTTQIEAPTNLPDEPTTEGRGKCIWRETEYVRALKDGTGLTRERSLRVLLRGMQSGSKVVAEQVSYTIFSRTFSIILQLSHDSPACS